MEKKDLITLLDKVFIPLGFKRKGASWIINGDTLSKVINLQKSNYGNQFYINYGFIIRKLELDTKTHVDYRLSGTTKDEQAEITELLDLDSAVSTENRFFDLEKVVREKVVSKIYSVNNEEDLLREIKKLPYLSAVPLIVKKYFNLI